MSGRVNSKTRCRDAHMPRRIYSSNALVGRTAGALTVHRCPPCARPPHRNTRTISYRSRSEFMFGSSGTGDPKSPPTPNYPQTHPHWSIARSRATAPYRPASIPEWNNRCPSSIPRDRSTGYSTCRCTPPHPPGRSDDLDGCARLLSHLSDRPTHLMNWPSLSVQHGARSKRPWATWAA